LKGKLDIMIDENPSAKNTLSVNIPQHVKPKFLIITGAVAVGKSTIRKEKVSKEFISSDAGDIFINLSKGEYYDFPSHLENKMEEIGSSLVASAINNKKNIVVELIGLHFESEFKQLLELILKIGYSIEVNLITCNYEKAFRRNLDRGENNISAFFTDKYHFKWFLNAANNYLKSHASEISEEEFETELYSLLSQLRIITKKKD
jgi:hypothetical protein